MTDIESAMKSASTRWVVRQQVCTVRQCWMVDVFDSQYERAARDEFDRLVEGHPDGYFELVQEIKAEICIAFNAKPAK